MKKNIVFGVLTLLMLAVLPAASANVWQPITELGGVRAVFPALDENREWNPAYTRIAGNFDGATIGDEKYKRYVVQAEHADRAQAMLDAKGSEYKRMNAEKYVLFVIQR